MGKLAKDIAILQLHQNMSCKTLLVLLMSKAKDRDIILCRWPCAKLSIETTRFATHLQQLIHLRVWKINVCSCIPYHANSAYTSWLPCCMRECKTHLERCDCRSVYFSSLTLTSLRTLSTAPGSQFTTASISLFASTKSSFLKTLWLRVVQLYCFCVSPCAPLQTSIYTSQTV